MIRPLKIFLILATAAVVVLGFAASPAAARKAAKKPACWKVLINDWYDGTVDGKYALRCYREALRHLKSETYALGYTSAYDDINRAYHQRRAELAGKTLPPDAIGGGDSTSGPPTGKGGPGTANPVAPDRWYPTAAPVQRTKSDGLIQRSIRSLGPDEATSIPIPLIVLAGIAGLLMAAGAASLIARRARNRRVTAPARPTPPSGSR